VAYARRNNNLSDSLKIFISTDCGLSWTNIYSKGGASLATAENTNQSFIPADTNWRKEIIGLAAYAIFPSVKFKFENKSDWGNNLYLDDINLEFAPTGIAVDENIIDVQVYPNPANRYINIEIRTAIPEVITLEIYDMLGSTVFKEQSEKTAGWQKQIDFSEASKGVYFVKVTNGNKVLNRKVVLQ
jgi:hypothetical protein